MNTRREGFTLAETMVVVVLGAVVMSSIYQMVVIQENTTRHQHAVISTSENVQAALAIIGNDLKEISAADGDVIAVDSISITFRALREAGVVCATNATNTIDVWELGGAIEAADSILVFNEGPNANSQNDDGWLRMAVGGAAVSTCGGVNPLGVATMRRLTVAGTPFTTVTAGAPVRVFTHTRYRLVDSGEWGQLLRTEGTQPETPIIEQLATQAEAGLRMRFFDAAGAAIPLNNLTARRAEIMRIQLKVAGKAITNASTTGQNRWRDSLLTQVYLRGNLRTQ